MSRGVLHLVVGPSGAGKDALIDALRAERPDLHVPVRVVTRAADAGGETHEAADPEAFAARAAEGGFALSWEAHGLRYGVPAEMADRLAEGRHVLVNVSRAVIEDARARFAPLRVLRVDAPAEIRARRLAGRGRESEPEIAARLARRVQKPVEGPDVVAIDNSGPIGRAVEAALAALAPAR